ncbi:MAG TPA: hypothetical protein VJY41_00660 [Prolixibacteraceae bacterium]|nr:hypothetical protein [Prolixibacteraceae bacterium]
MIATIVFMAVGTAFAQSVTIPDPNWPLDSVVNGSVHRFTVHGDPYYAEPSNFVWNVDGGRLFYDEALTRMAGNGTTATVSGDQNNWTTLWVVWDSFDQPLDTGYVYVYEISADSCQRSDEDRGKFQGMLIKVSAPPKVRFIKPETLVCSNDEGVNIDIEIDGMPPFDLKYSINGVVSYWHILPEDLIDSDFDGEINNVVIYIDDFVGTGIDHNYELKLLEASSGGVYGELLPYTTHTVYANVQGPAPIISESWREVTVGQTHIYTLEYEGDNPDTWYWELFNEYGDIMKEYSSSNQSYYNLQLDVQVGVYNLVAYYIGKNGCQSFADTMQIEVFPYPTIAFSEEIGDVKGCSEASINPNELFEFIVHYEGARAYNFTYTVYDYNGLFIDEFDVDWTNNRDMLIQIPNTFINSELPEINRAWKVKITAGKNEENLDIDILDLNIEGGRDERLIIIHPKPIIHEDIDFAN